MKKLVLVAVGAILLLGVVAVAAVLVATGGDVGGWSGGERAPQAAGPTGAAAVPLAVAPAPGGSTGPTGSTGYPPGPRRVNLSPGRVRVSLSEPLAHCFRAHPMSSTLPAVLTLDLEAQSTGGFAVVDVTVKSWGGATRALVECAALALRGQMVPGGGFTPGDRAIYEYSLEAPPSVEPPPPEPPPSSLPANRQQLPQRRGGSGR
ncbi:MAG TPA: hypothetical protein VFM53_05930 [Anaeromyxobacteraceae bacterium]|nr:hypothetical protein [Anaeromyxobacteraceae bacterium]